MVSFIAALSSRHLSVTCLTLVVIFGHPSIRAALVGNFSDQFSGMINLKNTLYNGNSSDVGYKETPDGSALYLYAAEGGWDYIQACDP